MINQNTNEGLLKFFKDLSEQSFKTEQQLYRKSGYGVNSVEQLYEKLLTDKGFQDYQKVLKKAVYGKYYEWLQYLYFYPVRNSIIQEFKDTQSFQKLWGEKGFKNLRWEFSSKKKNEFFDENGKIKKDNLEQVMLKIGAEIYQRFKDNFNSSYGGENDALKEEFLTEMGDTIMRNLFTGQYVLYKKVKGPGGKIVEQGSTHRVFNIEAKQTIKFTQKGDEYITDAFTVQAREFKRNFTGIHLDERSIAKNIQDGINAVILNDKYSDLRLKEKFDIGPNGSQFTVQLLGAGITGNAKNIDYNMVAEIFLGVVADAILKYKQKDVMIDRFDIISPERIKTLGALIQRNSYLVNELLKTNTAAATSGTMGEILMALFLNLMNSEYTVQVLGQKVTGSGQDAIDIALVKGTEKQLEGIGFQVKSGTSFNKGILLYEGSLNIYNNKYMARYFTNDIYQRFIEDLDNLWMKRGYSYQNGQQQLGGGEEEMSRVQFDLIRAIPNFLRYGQEDQLEEYKNIRNNFYIINFNFVPASVIFYCFYSSLSTEIGQKKIEESFGFGYDKQHPQNANSNGNYLLGTWDSAFLRMQEIAGEAKILNINQGPDVLDKEKNPYSSFDKNKNKIVPEAWKKNLKLYFSGLQINIKDKLEILLQKAM